MDRPATISHGGLKVLLVVALVAGLPGVSPAGARTVLSLAESVQIALQRNKRLAVAGEKVKQAETVVAESRARFFPQISSRATYTRLDEVPYIPLGKLPLPGAGPGGPTRIEVGDNDNYAIILSVQQPLYTGGKLRNGYRAAQAGAAAERLRLRQAEADLIMEVQKSYFGLLKMREVEKAARQAVTQVEAHVRDVENLYQAGMAAQNDLLKVRVRLSNVRVTLLQVHNGVQLAGVALCNLLGLPLDTQVAPSTRLDERVLVAERTLPQAIAQGLKTRPELASLERAAAAAGRAVAVARGQRLPDVKLVGNYNCKRPDRENDPDFYRSWDITLAAQWQVFDGGLRRSRVDRARSQLAQVRKTADAVHDGIVLEITQSYLKLSEAGQRAGATGQNVAQAEENFRVTDKEFKEGMATSTDLLDAQTLLTRARVDHATALADYRIDRAALDKAMGTVWPRTDPPGN